MSPLRVAAVLSALAVLFALQPLGAVENDPEVEIPEICGERELELAEDEVLVERTVWLHGESPVGNTDGAEEFFEGFGRLVMTDEEPDSPATKTYASNVAPGNTEFSGNFLLGYWVEQFPKVGVRRIVCAEAEVFAATRNPGNYVWQLYIDGTPGAAEPAAETRVDPASVEGTGVLRLTANFGEIDIAPRWNLILQSAPPTPGATVHYDSTLHSSKLTYVIVQEAPTS